MGGIGFLLNTAKDALLTQRLALDVVSHNIANVNTEGYSKQMPILEANTPLPFAGVTMGTGVDVDQVVRTSNRFLETRLNQRKSEFSSFEQQEVYLRVVEGFFNESAAGSLSTQLVQFWNSWHDLGNNPSGLSERAAVVQRGSLLGESFKALSTELQQLSQELNLSLQGGIEKINELLDEIAALNPQILSLSVESNANDLLDKRDSLISELSEYIDIRYFEQESGDVSVATASGNILVSHTDVYRLSLDGERVKWQSSGAVQVDITDSLAGGKAAGWLDMRDAFLPQYKSELDELAQSIIWQVNQIHSQGVGLEPFASIAAITGTYAATDTTEELWTVDSGLLFHDRIDSTGIFEVWVYDAGGNIVGGGPSTIDIDAPTVTSLDGLAATIDGLANLDAAVTADGNLSVYSDAGYSFAFSNDTSNVLAAVGMNTFFTGKDASHMEVNSVVNADYKLIAAARVDGSGDISSGDNANALDLADLQYQDVSMKRYVYERGNPGSPTEQAVDDTLDNYLYALISSIGIRSQSVTRSKEYHEVVANNLQVTRDSISAVSLDEEMTNLMKYQQAYTAAAKLITTADEMFQSLLETR